MNSVPTVSPAPSSSDDNFRGMKGWMKFIGIMSMVGGAAGALFTIIALVTVGNEPGALVLVNVVSLALCGLGIAIGVVLFQAGTRIDTYLAQPSEPTLAALTQKLKLYFTLMGINLIIGLVMGLVAFISIMSLVSQARSTFGF